MRVRIGSPLWPLLVVIGSVALCILASGLSAAAPAQTKEFLLTWGYIGNKITSTPILPDGTPSSQVSSVIEIPQFLSVGTQVRGNFLLASTISPYRSSLYLFRLTAAGVLKHAAPELKLPNEFDHVTFTAAGTEAFGVDSDSNVISGVRVLPGGKLKLITQVKTGDLPAYMAIDNSAHVIYLQCLGKQGWGRSSFISSYKIGSNGKLKLLRMYESNGYVQIPTSGQGRGNIVFLQQTKTLALAAKAGLVFSSVGKNAALLGGEVPADNSGDDSRHIPYKIFAAPSGTYGVLINGTHSDILTFSLLPSTDKNAQTRYNALKDRNLVSEPGEEGLSGPYFVNCAFSSISNSVYLFDLNNERIVTLRINKFGNILPGKSRVTPLPGRYDFMEVMTVDESGSLDASTIRRGTAPRHKSSAAKVLSAKPVVPLANTVHAAKPGDNPSLIPIPSPKSSIQDGASSERSANDLLYIIHDSADMVHGESGLSTFKAGRVPVPLSSEVLKFPYQMDTGIQDATGRFLYVIAGSGTVITYSIDDNGLLHQRHDLTDVGMLEDIAVAPSGNALYAASRLRDGFVAQFKRNPNGTLTPFSPDAVHGPFQCMSLALSPNGKRLYALGRGLNDTRNSSYQIDQYEIRSGGSLKREAVFGEPDAFCSGIVADPLGRYLFMTTAYGIDTFPMAADGTIAGRNRSMAYVAEHLNTDVHQFQHVRNLILDPAGNVGFAIEQAEDGTRSILTQYAVQANGMVKPTKNWRLVANGSMDEDAEAPHKNKEELLWLTLDPINHMLYVNVTGPAGGMLKSMEQKTYRLWTGPLESPEHYLYGYRLENDNTLLRPQFWPCTNITNPGYAIYVHRPAQQGIPAK